MGKYINKNSRGQLLQPLFKAEALMADGAKVVNGNTFQENMVCVVQNGPFDAALYVDENEFKYITEHPDPRPKIFLVYDHAKELAQ